MAKRLATVKVDYHQGKSRNLHIYKRVPQWFADAMAVRYLELMKVLKDTTRKDA